jgi:hypothetical protein
MYLFDGHVETLILNTYKNFFQELMQSQSTVISIGKVYWFIMLIFICVDMSWVSILKDGMDHAKWKPKNKDTILDGMLHVLVYKGWVYGVKDQVSWDETERY